MISIADMSTNEWVKRNFDEDDLDEVLEEEYYAPIADDPNISDEVREEVKEAIETHNQDYLNYMVLDCDEDGDEMLPSWLGVSYGLRLLKSIKDRA